MRELAKTLDLSTVYTTDESEMTTEKFRELVLHACRFYGAARLLEVRFSKEDWRGACAVGNLASKSFAEDFIMHRVGSDRYHSHQATNLITHRNLPGVHPGNLTEFLMEPFMRKYAELVSGSVSR